jgi:hypothetical protein
MLKWCLSGLKKSSNRPKEPKLPSEGQNYQKSVQNSLQEAKTTKIESRPPPEGQKRSKSVQNRPREAKNSQNAPKHGQVPGFFEKYKIPHSFSDHFLVKNTFFSLF